MNLHVKLCAGWALSPAISSKPPRRRDAGLYRYVALHAECAVICWRSRWRLRLALIGYAEIATRLASRPLVRCNEPYRAWIAEYAGAPYQEGRGDSAGAPEVLADRYARRPARRS